MANIHLDARLAQAADFVANGSVAADIGCDHGKLACALSYKCSKVIAVDCADKPLSRAKELIARLSINNVECRLGNGLNAIAEGEAAFIIIAGLSAETICDILSSCPWAKNDYYTFILIPTTKHNLLRKQLYQNGFCIDEALAKAAGRIYSVMRVKYCGKLVHLSDKMCARGFASGDNTAQYLNIEAGKLLKQALGEDDDTSRATLAVARYLQTEAKKCQI